MTVREQVVPTGLTSSALCDVSTNPSTRPTGVRDAARMQWLKSERVLQHVRKLLGNVEPDDEIQPSLVTHEPSQLEPFLPTVPRPPPPVKLDLPTVQRLAPRSYVASGLLTTEDAEASAAAAAADVDLLLGSADDSTTFLPSQIERSPQPARTTRGRRGVCTGATAALQEELAADEGVLRAAEEKMGANMDVMKREREQLRDHRGKALGTTSLAILSVVVVAITL
ncbi:hypothetical protein EDB85DRAFT_1891323 [Lactarius pseudohatsudake]|nr:hypothetical protein EDB85DRAFT_1891323 [Lactarius pseudohatsudake]